MEVRRLHVCSRHLARWDEALGVGEAQEERQEKKARRRKKWGDSLAYVFTRANMCRGLCLGSKGIYKLG